MSIPLFPKLTPRVIDHAWHNTNLTFDDDTELTQMEQDHQAWLNSISQKNADLIPVGKTQAEPLDDEEEEDDEEDNDDDDESETHDEEDEDEIEMDVSHERSSPVDISIRMVQIHSVR